MSKQYMFWYVVLALIALLAALFPPALSGRLVMAHVAVAAVVAVLLPPGLIWLAQKMGSPIGRPVTCARCGTELPMFRRPSGLRQGLLGGYDCPGCGASLDARGRERTASR